MEDKEFTMLFGTSYKNWFTQLQQFIWRNISWWDSKQITRCHLYKIIKVEKARHDWISFGGLKWCREQHFQKELDHEAEGRDWRTPRDYDAMIFQADKGKYYKTKNFLKDRMMHLAGSNISEIKEALANQSSSIT